MKAKGWESELSATLPPSPPPSRSATPVPIRGRHANLSDARMQPFSHELVTRGRTLAQSHAQPPPYGCSEIKTGAWFDSLIRSKCSRLLLPDIADTSMS